MECVLASGFKNRPARQKHAGTPGELRTGKKDFSFPPRKRFVSFGGKYLMSNFVSKEQYQQACCIDLSEWLLSHHPDDVTVKYGSVLLINDEHVSVKLGFHGFHNFKTGESGNNVDYLTHFLGYSYPEAVLALLDEEEGDGPEDDPDTSLSCTSKDRQDILHFMVSTLEFSYEKALQLLTEENLQKIFQFWRGYGASLENAVYTVCGSPSGKSADAPAAAGSKISCPPPGSTNRNLYAFLQTRGIPSLIIRDLIDRKLLYQDDHNNAVFVTPQRDYCEIRGTNTFADNRCRNSKSCKEYQEAEHLWCCYMDDCTDYHKSSFHGCRRSRPDRFWYLASGLDSQTKVSSVYVCEAAIDAISLYLIHQQHGITVPAAYVSIGGAGNQQAINRLKKHNGVIIATDHDEAGDTCRDRNPELSTIVPVYKDWNEDLQKGAFYAEEFD